MGIRISDLTLGAKVQPARVQIVELVALAARIPISSGRGRAHRQGGPLSKRLPDRQAGALAPASTSEWLDADAGPIADGNEFSAEDQWMACLRKPCKCPES